MSAHTMHVLAMVGNFTVIFGVAIAGVGLLILLIRMALS